MFAPLPYELNTDSIPVPEVPRPQALSARPHSLPAFLHFLGRYRDTPAFLESTLPPAYFESTLPPVYILSSLLLFLPSGNLPPPPPEEPTLLPDSELPVLELHVFLP